MRVSVARTLAQLRLQQLVEEYGQARVCRALRGKKGLELVNHSMVSRWARGVCQPSYTYARPLLRVTRRLRRFGV